MSVLDQCDHVRYSKPSEVYLIVWGDFVKVGVSQDPEVRLGQIRRRNPGSHVPDGVTGEPVLLRTVLGDRLTEHLIHLALAPYSVGYEWFRKAGPVEVIVQAFAPVTAEPGAVVEF